MSPGQTLRDKVWFCFHCYQSGEDSPVCPNPEEQHSPSSWGMLPELRALGVDQESLCSSVHDGFPIVFPRKNKVHRQELPRVGMFQMKAVKWEFICSCWFWWRVPFLTNVPWFSAFSVVYSCPCFPHPGWICLPVAQNSNNRLSLLVEGFVFKLIFGLLLCVILFDWGCFLGLLAVLCLQTKGFCAMDVSPANPASPQGSFGIKTPDCEKCPLDASDKTNF